MPAADVDDRNGARAASHSKRQTRAVILALGAAVIALSAGLVAAVGPAESQRSEYLWPPKSGGASSIEAKGWYAPLPLFHRVPDSIVVRLPCALDGSSSSGSSSTVLATARRPDRVDALWVTRGSDSLEVGVGGRALAEIPWPESCPLRLEVADGVVGYLDRSVPLELSTPHEMPLVTGLFTDVDPRTDGSPAVRVVTRPHGTSQTTLQLTAAALAIVAGLACLLLVGRPARRRRRLAALTSSVSSALHPVDGVVVGALAVWWIIAPPLFDDSWRWVVHRLFGELGTFGSYFEYWGVDSPQGHWLGWLRHSAVGIAGDDLIELRIPSLLALVGVWFVGRWCVGRIIPRAPLWLLAAVFLLHAFAWGMTLRSEPFVSLLVVVSSAAAISFVRAPRLAPLGVGIAVCALAVSVNPTGIVAAAPILAALPAGISWLRADAYRRGIGLAALALVGAAFVLVALTVDADLATRLGDAQTVRQGEFHGQAWWREYVRYTTFDDEGGATATRHLSLTLLLFAVVAWVTRFGRGTTLSALPARSLALALTFLAFTPSKWPWHFGVLAGLGGVAIVVELAALERERTGALRRPVREVVLLSLFTLGFIWSWSAEDPYSPLDLQNMRWGQGFGLGAALAITATVIAGAIVRRLVGLRRGSATRAPIALSTIATSATFLVLGVTTLVLVVDAAVSPWSPARQNLAALARNGSCGLAHRLGDDVVARLDDPGTLTIAVPPVATFFPCATLASVRSGVIEVPDLLVFESLRGPWPLETDAGPAAAFLDLYPHRRIARGPHGVEVHEFEHEIPGLARLDVVRRVAGVER